MPNELESLCNASGRGVKFQPQLCRWNRLPFRQLPGMQAGEGTSAQAVPLAGAGLMGSEVRGRKR